MYFGNLKKLLDLRGSLLCSYNRNTGCIYMALEVLILPSSKRIIVTVPENLLDEVENMMTLESKNRSEIVREAIRFYLGERKRTLKIEQMKKGYLEMAEINLSIAWEHSGVDEEAMANCLQKLLE